MKGAPDHPLIGNDTDIVAMLGRADLAPQLHALLAQWRQSRSFPKPIKGTDLYYLPAITRWLAATCGLPTTPAADTHFVVGQGENWNAWKTRKTRRSAVSGPGMAPAGRALGGAVATNDNGAEIRKLPVRNETVERDG